MADQSWRDLTADERRRFLLVLEGMRRGAREQLASGSGTHFDDFMARAIVAAMSELRKADQA